MSLLAGLPLMTARSTAAAIYRLADEYGWRFEAKKDSLRQTQDNLWKLGFTVAELPQAVAMAPAGSRYFVILMPPLEEIGDATPASPPAEQAAPPRATAPQNSRELTEMERARTRAAILCNDRQFQWWLDAADSEQAAERVRLRIGGSRSIIATNRKAFEAFIALETDYRAGTGQQAERR